MSSSDKPITRKNLKQMERELLEAVRQKDIAPHILIVASAEVYGNVKPEDLPINEQTPLNPANPYAVSKIAQDFLGLQYFLSYSMNVIRVRPFAHIGPRLSDKFVVSAFSKQIAEIEKGKKEPVLKVGNLNAKRDLTDVRDMVRAYQLILENGTKGDVYNIGSGVSHKISDILDMLLADTTTHIEVKVDDALLRPIDIPDLVCDYSKMNAITGWKPEVPFEKSVKDTLEYWREQV